MLTDREACLFNVWIQKVLKEINANKEVKQRGERKSRNSPQIWSRKTLQAESDPVAKSLNCSVHQRTYNWIPLEIPQSSPSLPPSLLPGLRLNRKWCFVPQSCKCTGFTVSWSWPGPGTSPAWRKLRVPGPTATPPKHETRQVQEVEVQPLFFCSFPSLRTVWLSFQTCVFGTGGTPEGHQISW